MGSHDLRLKKVEDDDAEDFVDECKALAARLQSKHYVYPLSQTRNPHMSTQVENTRMVRAQVRAVAAELQRTAAAESK